MYNFGEGGIVPHKHFVFFSAWGYSHPPASRMEAAPPASPKPAECTSQAPCQVAASIHMQPALAVSTHY